MKLNQILINCQLYDIQDKDLENILTIEDGKLILKDAYGVKELINHKDKKMVIGNINDDVVFITKSGKIKIGTDEQNVSDLEIVGKKYIIDEETNGEIFNDYKNNVAGASYAHAEGYNTHATGYQSHTEGRDTVAAGNQSHAEGYKTHAVGYQSHTEGYNTQASGYQSHAEGQDTIASEHTAHAEGYNTRATSYQSHSEGFNTQATGRQSHAEGNGNTANGGSSHVEGWDNIANGDYCHVEGGHNTASGSGSHAEGIGTQTNNDGEHAEGKYNLSNNGTETKNKTRHSIGIGSKDSNRYNAFEIMENGDIYIYGIGGYDGKNISEAQTVQEIINSLISK